MVVRYSFHVSTFHQLSFAGFIPAHQRLGGFSADLNHHAVLHQAGRCGVPLGRAIWQ
jgi:hypothetical protein